MKHTGPFPRRCLQHVTIGSKYVNMADINSSVSTGAIVGGGAGTIPSAPEALASSDTRPSATAHEADLVAMVELLFFAYRDFTAEPDAILSPLGFGRAHHRVLHFVNRHPGLRVAGLLDVLRITKQSLARVLKQLVDEGFVQQAAGESDRRERRLHVTAKGQALAERLLQLQTQRMAAALSEASVSNEAGGAAGPIARSFLLAVIAGDDRAEVNRLVEGGRDTVRQDGVRQDGARQDGARQAGNRLIEGHKAGGHQGERHQGGGQRGTPPHSHGGRR